MNFFLKQQPITVILLILIIPSVLQMIIVNLAQIYYESNVYYLLFGFFLLLYFPFFYWLYRVVQALYAMPNDFFNLKFKHFRMSFIVSILVILNFTFFVAYVFKIVFNGGRPDTDLFFYVFIFQMIGIASFGYNSYFVCKLLATLELKRTVSFSDFMANFALLAFPPTAIWLMQSKAIKMVSDEGKQSGILNNSK